MTDTDDDLEHPALKNFNEPMFTAKHVAKKTLKGGLIGGAAGGIVLATALGVGVIASVPFGGLLAAVGLASGIGTGVAVSGLTAAATTGALVGGGVGAATGLVIGASGTERAVDDEKERIVAQAERMEARHERAVAMQAHRDQLAAMSEAQAAQMGIAPPQGLPQKQPEGLGLS